MNAVKVLLLLVAGIILVAILGAGCAMQGYNKAKLLDQDVKEQWAQVENQLQRRYDLIPNLVNTVKGVAGQEQKIIQSVTDARQGYLNARTPEERQEAATQVENSLARVLVLTERYPELRSSESFLKLQDQLEGTENRLSVERLRYNEAVRRLNVFISQIPGRFYAQFAGVKEVPYFKTAEAAKSGPPKVDFSEPQKSG